MRKPTGKKSKLSVAPARPRANRMHTSQCSICRHRRRDEIEHDFLDWVSAREIARTFHLGSHATVYRHAHATGLFDQRRRNLIAALDQIIEHVGEVKPTAGNIISAIALSWKMETNGGRGSAGRASGPFATLDRRIMAAMQQQNAAEIMPAPPAENSTGDNNDDDHEHDSDEPPAASASVDGNFESPDVPPADALREHGNSPESARISY